MNLLAIESIEKKIDIYGKCDHNDLIYKGKITAIYSDGVYRMVGVRMNSLPINCSEIYRTNPEV